MKKLIAGFFFVSPFFASAQYSDEASLIQSLFGSDKRTIVSEFVRAEGEQKTAFLNVYDEYENERKHLGQKKFATLNNYVKNYSSLTDSETEQVMSDIMQLSNGQNKLLTSYYKKIKKKFGVVAAAQFYQIEWYLLSEIRTSILENIPVIGQLENKK